MLHDAVYQVYKQKSKLVNLNLNEEHLQVIILLLNRVAMHFMHLYGWHLPYQVKSHWIFPTMMSVEKNCVPSPNIPWKLMMIYWHLVSQEVNLLWEHDNANSWRAFIITKRKNFRQFCLVISIVVISLPSAIPCLCYRNSITIAGRRNMAIFTSLPECRM